jgi:adenosine deaminase
MISVNTDDPKMFHNSLAQEYMALIEQFQFTEKDIYQLIQNAIHCSWCSQEKKEALHKKLAEYSL